MESARPRLSWRLESDERNVRQSAYRILAASSEEALKAGRGDLWDSGKIRSGESFGIEYNGCELRSRERCWWNVQVWDEQGGAVTPSEMSGWEMGLLNSQDWSAQWLAVENAAGEAVRQAGLQWIWGEPKPGACVRKFRGQFKLPSASTGGMLYAVVNDIRIWSQITRIWIDGEPIAGPGTWLDATGQAELSVLEKTFTPMTAGEHLIAVEVRTADVPEIIQQGPLLFALAVLGQFELVDGAVFHLKSGIEWKTSLTDDEHWYSVDYDDRRWQAARKVPLEGYQPLPLEPAMHLRREFHIDRPIVQARLYATALGAYEARLNGKRVDDAYLTPEVSQYARRVLYRVFDVTERVQRGDNTLGLTVGDGWYASFDGHFSFGPPPRRALAQLEVTLADGTRQIIATGPGWRTAESPIRHSELKSGELYDARLEQPGWDRNGFDAGAWHEGKLIDAPPCGLTAQETTADVPTRGNLVPDAHLASILAGHGVTTVCTHDRDFRKFSFLDVRDPLL